MKIKISMFTILFVLAIAVAGCGDSGAGYPSDDALDAAGGPSAQTEETSSSKPGKPPKVTGDLDSKPDIARPKGDPPEELVIKDIKKGTGATAKDGDKLSVDYVGINWDTGMEFDTSWGKQPFEFILGEGGVIKGWDQGVKGMKVGGRRELVVPPDLAYGETGSGSGIPPNSTLVFVVDLQDIK